MKHGLLFSFLLFFGLSFAQSPEGYYDETDGLTGYELKTKLSQITSQGHSAKSYGALWGFFNEYELDKYYENDNTILDVYSENPEREDPYTYEASEGQCGSAGYSQEGDCYNREHLMPQSWFNKGMPMRTDIHHIFPVDGYVNAIHGHMPFGEVDNPTQTSLNGSKKGQNSYDFPGAYTGQVFEPIDEFKGDIARTYLYMAMRYENQISNWQHSNSGSQNTFDGTSDQVFNDWTIDMLLKWHKEDPVSQREIVRNDAAYDFQGNRNPFVDHPEFAEMIWRPEEYQAKDVIFEEDFNDCEIIENQFITVSEMSSADWECTSSYGQHNTGAIQMNAFVDGENQPSLDWLITADPISTDGFSEEELSFYAASTFGNTPLQVLYSHDYDGSENPSDFDWHTISGVSLPTHTGIENQEIQHYFSNIDISTLAQNDFYLAFRYDNTNGQDATRWTIDDVKITGVQEMSIPKHEELEVSIYPNPIDNGKNLKVNLPQAEAFDYVIYDLNGRLLQEEKIKENQTEISTDKLESGVYLIKINQENQKAVKRLIVK